ncbi:tRNA lysidine(34) synthetase TilS [Chryseobacterium gambrini]|uniref:tRNA(Ile)-lysidine synthase n=1 Tax=Chryseobacterium gambrini TaxID=373672 RepID=A0AAJ1VJX2_9FLAO|nr:MULTISPECIES: tRNA lysidine(34) synthetase TilS [Chryseobacterium]MDN4012903.1 tRNA lysidine(34) synthetase TilS [Chryseobacterium gambrini]MDN4030588.1 tRNA lysidine(34) synthetase TilS [Chryseobacterium gambrini]QWA36560.1 tRNA lysidine(34) synthetase TilS [Chryseobacterium sp. ZHDP1]
MLNLDHFKNQLKNIVDSPENRSYLLAVSGGADSMVLAHCFKDLDVRFQVAHINYKLRGEDSDLDQKTVEDFCEKNDIKFHLYKVSEKDQKPENSIQLWARELRYQFFRKVQKEENLEFLVTAHHLNDQLETFIINLSKAAGINGLSGIPANDNHILRPLLNFTKGEIYEFAEENNIEYREDLSNKKNDYLRNKIRNEIIPKLLETNDHFLENFKKSSSYLNQTKDFVQQQIQEIENRISVFNKEYKVLSKNKLNQESDFVKFEILKKYGFNQEEEIPKIFKAENGSTFFSKDYRLIVNYDELVVSKKMENGKWKPEEQSNDEILLMENFDFSENQITFNLESIIEIEQINKSFEWEFDAQKIRFPLRLRKQKDGDEFFPAGFSGKKKVSKFFRDEKISILARQKIWLLTDGEDSVLGIIPFRQDRNFMATKDTKKTLKIR